MFFIKNFQNPFLVGMMCALLTLVSIYVVPFIINPLTVSDCQPDPTYPKLATCQSLNNGWQLIENGTWFFGHHIVPLLIGIWFGIRYVRGREKLSGIASMIFIASVTYIVLSALFEVVRYRPWHSVPYNRYHLNAIFGTVFAVYFFLLSVIGGLLPVLFSTRLWQRFKPLGLSSTQEPKL